MRNVKGWIVVFFAASLFCGTGCVRIMSSAISDSNRTAAGREVSAQNQDMGFVEVVAPPTLTTGANATLASQCPSGKFTNVQTELTLRDWFAIVQVYTVNADAYCM
ncbi:MAG TPA: hypothetical protein VIX12_05220 [Candidatus Binataceae bacterium]